MTAKIIPFKGITKLDLDPDTILESLKGRLDGFVILGYEKDSGDTRASTEFFSSTYADGGQVMWLLERCKHKLMNIADE